TRQYTRLIRGNARWLFRWNFRNISRTGLYMHQFVSRSSIVGNRGCCSENLTQCKYCCYCSRSSRPSPHTNSSPARNRNRSLVPGCLNELPGAFLVMLLVIAHNAFSVIKNIVVLLCHALKFSLYRLFNLFFALDR